MKREKVTQGITTKSTKVLHGATKRYKVKQDATSGYKTLQKTCTARWYKMKYNNM